MTTTPPAAPPREAFSRTEENMTTYISPSLPGMIRNLWKSDLSERSVRTALNLAGDLIQELIDLRDQDDEFPGIHPDIAAALGIGDDDE